MNLMIISHEPIKLNFILILYGEDRYSYDKPGGGKTVNLSVPASLSVCINSPYTIHTN